MSESKRILLTGGRAPATLELVRLFAKAGHTVFVAESVPHPLTRLSRFVTRHYQVPAPRFNSTGYIEALLQLVRREGIELLVPTCEEIFTIAEGRECLAAACHVFAENLTRLEPLHHKWKFIEHANSYGLKVPRTMLVEDEAAFQTALAWREPLVLKPVYSRFAAKVVFIHVPCQTSPVKLMPQSPWVAQQFIAGRQICTYSVAQAGCILAHAAYPAEFTAGSGATILFQPLEHLPSFDWVKKFVAAENFTGQIAFDFIETASGELYALECNPRTTSGVHLLASNPCFANVFWNKTNELVKPLKDNSVMLSAAMVLYALPTVSSWTKLKHWLKTFVSSRDVIFISTDPLPVLSQFLSVLFFFYQGLRQGISALEASTWDIEWNGRMVASQNSFEPQ